MVLSDKLKRSVTLTLAALLFLASLVPLLTRQKADAYALLGPRLIQMSSSASNAAPDGDGDGNGDGINVTYHVEFDVTTPSTNLEGIVVTFCSNSPIIGDTDCTLPAGFDLGAAVLAGGATGDVNVSAWTDTVEVHDTANTVGNENTFILSDATGAATVAGNTIAFDITGVTNPTASNTTFYARIYTFDTDTAATGYTLADPDAGVGGPSVDAGGIALSTANQITITSKVQERLTFCVYTQDPIADPFDPTPITGDNNCSAKTGNTINLGDTNGVLDSAGPFVDKSAYYGVTTNAAGQAAIRIKGDTLELTDSCAAGSCRIEAIGATAQASSDPADVQQEQFGLCTYEIAGSGLAVTSLYNGAQAYTFNATGDGTGDGCNSANVGHTSGGASPVFGTGGDGDATFAFDLTNINTTYGQTIASKPAGAFSTGNLVFIGNITDTTEPGIYTTTLTFVATGTY